jgi:CRP/FNR family transcriptional regulator
MSAKLTLSGLRELRLPLRGTPGGPAAVLARGARALFRRPPTAELERRSLAEFLAQVSLFEGLGRRDLARLARIVHEREYANGEYVCEEGRPGAALFIVRRGVVEVTRRGDGGEDLSVALLEPPASFEESAAVGQDGIRWFSARARGPVSLLALGKPDLEALIADFPLLASTILVRLAGIMAARLQTLVEAELLGASGASGEDPR